MTSKIEIIGSDNILYKVGIDGFQSQFDDIAFIMVEEEMKQLNDLCYLFLNETQKKVDDIQKSLQSFKSDPNKIVENDLGLVNADFVTLLEQFELPAWENTYSFLAKANCIMLLYAFIEKSLKTLCEFLYAGTEKPRQRHKESKVNCYIRFLQETCLIKFKIDSKVGTILQTLNHSRNDFAHGDWDRLRSRVHRANLRNYFKLTAKLFTKIEIAYNQKSKTFER